MVKHIHQIDSEIFNNKKDAFAYVAEVLLDKYFCEVEKIGKHYHITVFEEFF